MRSCLTFTILMFCGIFSFALKPLKDYTATPKDYNIDFEEIVVQSGDAEISTWHLLQKTPTAKYILICNSDYGNMSYSLPQAAELYKQGYNIILFDYRGFGKSSSFGIDSNVLFYNEFCADLSSVFQFYLSKTKIKPAIYGRSMGSIIATICYSENPGLYNTRFVFEPLIESLQNAKQTLYTFKGRTFSSPRTDKQYDESIQKLKKAKVLVFKGSKDNVSHDLKYSISSAQWTIVKYDGGHMQAALVLGAKYWTDIIEFLSKK